MFSILVRLHVDTLFLLLFGLNKEAHNKKRGQKGTTGEPWVVYLWTSHGVHRRVGQGIGTSFRL